MKCPIDDRELVMSERHGIEIDYCPTCRGVWLDRGELDKIVERASADFSAANAPLRRDDRRADRLDQWNDDCNERGDRGKPSKVGRKKKDSFLSELFEFGG